MNEIFEKNDFSITKYLDKNNILKKLERLDEYINFAIKATVLKQTNIYNIDEQKKCGKQILFNYLLEDKNEFTKILNISDNIVTIDKNDIFNLLIKSSIEIDCYNRNNNSDINLCKNITKNIYNGEYNMVKKLILEDPYMLKEVISNYVDFKYQKDDIFNSKLEVMYRTDYIAHMCMQQLILAISLDSNSKSK